MSNYCLKPNFMLHQIKNTNLYIGNKEDEKKTNRREFVIIHACKSYFDIIKSETFEKNSKIKLSNNELYINWEDLPDSDYFDILTFNQVLFWMKYYYSGDQKILVHCDWGQSRSPTLVLVFMSKVLKVLPDNFFDALEEFKILYPEYVTPSGISKFVKANWKNLKAN